MPIVTGYYFLGSVQIYVDTHLDENSLRFPDGTGRTLTVIERLNLLAQAKSTVQLAQFTEGDRVSFTADDGTTKHGTIMRLNKKTAGLCTDDGQQWKVSPGLLRKST
ncbi:hypothetical protein [Pusillimonas sp. ANT_WB101]|uniref:hypothetical protein n=1 Tax=Pusillimonas sp. ANT_WB101 TaxID=2597356 RepID=UPI0011EC03F8|nr:hypothetical protein [Pusillimonas sp. ANT_WB101]KAA0911377.1 hypothetical protein FQ179_05950 [Pusillimonas sp. ANT_WB101]